jgi:hypothetical protein
VTVADDALDRLPSDARDRLRSFVAALDRVHVDDLSLYVARRRQPRHRRAVEAAELVAAESGLRDVVAAARHAALDGLMRTYVDASLRVSYVGLNPVGGGGSVEDRVRVAESVSDAITAIVLGDRLDAHVRGELLGLWDRLLP